MIDLFLLGLVFITVAILIADLREGDNVHESLVMVAMTVAAMVIHYQFLREII